MQSLMEAVASFSGSGIFFATITKQLGHSYETVERRFNIKRFANHLALKSLQ
jgi:hypothetical protein